MRQILRNMWAILKACRHPMRTTVIDYDTGADITDDNDEDKDDREPEDDFEEGGEGGG